MTDESDWQLFIRADDSIGSFIKVDIALRYERLFAHNWFEIRILFSREQVDSNGVPAAETQRLFFEFEDQLGLWLTPIGGRFAAIRTNRTARSIFVHGPHDLNIGIQAIAGRHKDLDIAVLPAEFSDVLALMPSKLEASLAQDRRIFDVLDREGDDGRTPRKTLYWIYDVDPQHRAELEQRLKHLGFTVELHKDKPINFARFAPIDLLSMEEDTRSLFELCEELGCSYDGWETEVMRANLN